MKKPLIILSVLVAAIVAIAFSTSCESENTKELKIGVAVFDKQCPVNMGMVGDLLSVKYDEKKKEVQYYMSLNDDMVSLDLMKKNEKMARQTLKLSFSKNDANAFLEQMIKAGAGLSVTYKSASTGKTLNISFTPDELKQIKNNPITEKEISRLLLNNMLAMTNAGCPHPIYEGVEMEKVFEEGDNVVYIYRVDEEMYDISPMKARKKEAKDGMKEMFKDPSMKRDLGVLKSLDKGLVFRSYGDQSRDSIDIIFTNEEIRRNL